jgi:hypothetical protein
MYILTAKVPGSDSVLWEDSPEGAQLVRSLCKVTNEPAMLSLFWGVFVLVLFTSHVHALAHGAELAMLRSATLQLCESRSRNAPHVCCL